MQNARLDEIKIAGRNTNNLRYADDTTLMAKSEEELKTLLTEESTGGTWDICTQRWISLSLGMRVR